MIHIDYRDYLRVDYLMFGLISKSGTPETIRCDKIVHRHTFTDGFEDSLLAFLSVCLYVTSLRCPLF